MYIRTPVRGDTARSELTLKCCERSSNYSRATGQSSVFALLWLQASFSLGEEPVFFFFAFFFAFSLPLSLSLSVSPAWELPPDNGLSLFRQVNPAMCVSS